MLEDTNSLDAAQLQLYANQMDMQINYRNDKLNAHLTVHSLITGHLECNFASQIGTYCKFIIIRENYLLLLILACAFNILAKYLRINSSHKTVPCIANLNFREDFIDHKIAR